MSTLKRKLLLCCIGLLAGLAVWPIVEIYIMFQANFSSYLSFNIILGIIFGIVMGIFYGSADGIIARSSYFITSGIIYGIIIGGIGGVLGFLAGQFSLFVIGEYLIHSTKHFNLIGFPVARALGWAVLGIFIGLSDGIRSRSWDKIKVGFLGGISGGFVGGLALEYAKFIFPSITLARLIGLLIFGFFIGLFYSFIEYRLSYGVLRVLNGLQKGKEYLINKRKLKIGITEKNDIILSSYNQVNELHAEVYIKKNEAYIRNIKASYPVYVNEDKVNNHQLKYEDVIKIGSAKFFYKIH
jgi:hypothetical protein